MGFNKNKGISAVAILCILAVFTALAFLLPLTHTLTFWMGYGFTVLAALIMLACLLFLFDAGNKEKTFLRLPLVKIAWAYFLLQALAGAWEITNFMTSYLTAMLVNCGLTVFFILAILASKAASEAIERQDAHIAQKTFFLTNIQNLLAATKTNDDDLSEQLKRLEEDFKFSDPMSHSMLGELEKQIEAKVVMLKSEIKDPDKASASIEGISDMLKERNQKCRLLKEVKEEAPDKDHSGVKYVAVTIGLLGTLAAIVLVVCSIVIPNNIYKTGTALYESEQYQEAIVVFESLDGFGDSSAMISACETGIKESKYLEAQQLFENKEYDAATELFAQLDTYKNSKDMIDACAQGVKELNYIEAQQLFENKEYDAAIALFESLGSYKDSAEMIESVKNEITENKYELAQSYFNSQNYVEAIKLYTELGEYRDCAQKLEQIQNRLATDDVLYFGTYQNNPIAWQVVQSDDDKMLLIAKDSICELPYNDEIKNVSWTESSLYAWLNSDFINAFSEAQLTDVLSTEVDGVMCKVFLLSQEEAEDVDKRAILSSDKDYWLRTKAENNAVFITMDGAMEEDGDSVVRAKGVRPCIWIRLK